jgi:hypothetical protein
MMPPLVSENMNALRGSEIDVSRQRIKGKSDLPCVFLGIFSISQYHSIIKNAGGFDLCLTFPRSVVTKRQ